MSIIKYKLAFLFIAAQFIFVQLAYCQENYISGFIISQSGDTIPGFVDYQNWDKNPDVVSFKKNETGTTFKYSPSTIKGFGASDEIYLSAPGIRSEVSTTQTDIMKPYPELKIIMDTTFLQSIFLGDKSLFLLKNKQGVNNFYILKDGAFDLLEYKQYKKKIGGNDVVSEVRNFVVQLKEYFADCPAVQSEIMAMEFDKKNLEKLFSSYYKTCSESGLKFQKTTEPLLLNFGIVAGVSATSLAFNGSAFDYLEKVDFPTSISAAAGISLDVVLPRNRRKWSIYNELLITSYSSKGEFNTYVSENNYSNTTSTFKLTYLNLNNLLRYKHSFGKVSAYINAGISSGFSLGQTNIKETEFKLFVTERTEIEPAVKFTRNMEFAGLIGLGAQYNNYSLELRYEQGNGFSDIRGLGSTTSSFYFLLGYGL